MKVIRPTSLAALCALASAGSVHAAVLMLDFGPTTVSAASLTNSPYHSVNTSFTGTSWNKVQTVDHSSVSWSDGSPAAGVSVNVGTGTSSTLTMSGTPSGNSALGNKGNSGIYAGSSVGTDGIFTGGTSAVSSVGVQIGGLAAGTYTVYIAGRNTNADGNQQNFFVGAGTSTTSFDFTGYSTQSLAYASSYVGNSESWINGTNYASISITITAENPYLNVAALGGSSGDKRGFLNSIQIVSAVPEPSSFALLGGAAALGLVALRRRRRA